ncbi:hypothetical protein M0805_004208 [Coniferiporia weirii]|nr:hypothetical protein M0805_004208 [Coniferiporia weirii]
MHFPTDLVGDHSADSAYFYPYHIPDSIYCPSTHPRQPALDRVPDCFSQDLSPNTTYSLCPTETSPPCTYHTVPDLQTFKTELCYSEDSTTSPDYPASHDDTSHQIPTQTSAADPAADSFYSDCSAAASMASFSSVHSNSKDESPDLYFSDNGAAEGNGFDLALPSPASPIDCHSPVDAQSQSQTHDAFNSKSTPDLESLMNIDRSDMKKRGSRRIWTHALEKYLFTPHEIATLGTPHRRTIYLASLEAHIDRLHSQLLGLGLYPIPVDELQPYKGLNCKTAKGMVAGLQHDYAEVRMQMLEIERATENVRAIASAREGHEILGARKFSLDSSMSAGHS